MGVDLGSLLEYARRARQRAYAPYSRYAVGAAVLGDNGNVYQGANVENASYGLSLCAERSAVAAAIFDGVRRIQAVAVVTTTSPPVAPCGMCRQTLAEFALDCPVVLGNESGERVDTTLAELLPRAFHGDDIR
jgi:cytidine deaminase